jgi:hypothetical protein
MVFIVRGMNEKETQRVVRAYPVDKSVTVYFDPNNAASAVLEQGVWWPMFPILAFSVTLPLLMPAITFAKRKGSGLLRLQSLDIPQERLLMAFGLDVLVNLAKSSIRVDDKAGAIPVHRAFVFALSHTGRL